jgi:M6 family metalloprotease-like protein
MGRSKNLAAIVVLAMFGCAQPGQQRGGSGGAMPVDGGAVPVDGGGSGGSSGSGGQPAGGSDGGTPDSLPDSQGGPDGAGDGGAAIHEGWPSYDEATAAPLSTPVLIVLTDFKDSDIGSYLPNPEVAWSNLMFGRNQGQGNHYWYEVSQGQLQLIKARESYGQADNGVVQVHLTATKPITGQYVVQDQPWIREALDLAGQYVRFADYDRDHDGRLGNRELTVLFVLNLDFPNIAGGAGAEANIPLNHPISGSGVVLEKFLRVEDDYTSIGTPCHELGHHILGLKHAVAPTDHDLMGLGAYAQDPVITRLHVNDHYATRPTGPTGLQRIMAGLVKPTPVTGTMLGVKLYSPQSRNYNVLQIPVVDGSLYLENRTAEGYDRSIPFCAGHTGGLFGTEISQYNMPLNIPGIAAHASAVMFDEPETIFCDHYSLAGHNDTFTIGGYTVSKVSAAGPVMTVDITRNPTTPAIQSYKLRYWINNPAKAGYRMFHNVTAEAGKTTVVDFATFPSGTDPTGYFTIGLDAYYNTGEVRAMNAEVTWTSSSPYLVLLNLPIMNPGSTRGDSIINMVINRAVTRAPTVTLTIASPTFNTSVRLINVP